MFLYGLFVCLLFFFFKQKTAYEMRISDWSSDVCSSDLDADDLDAIRHFAVAWLRNEQNGDLAAFGVSFDVYFLESSLYADGMVEETVRELVAHGPTP